MLTDGGRRYITGDPNVSPPGQEEYPGPTQEGSGGGGGSHFQNAIPNVVGDINVVRVVNVVIVVGVVIVIGVVRVTGVVIVVRVAGVSEVEFR